MQLQRNVDTSATLHFFIQFTKVSCFFGLFRRDHVQWIHQKIGFKSSVSKYNQRVISQRRNSTSVKSYVPDKSGVLYGTSSCVVKKGQLDAFKSFLAKCDLINKARSWDRCIFYYATQDVENDHLFRWFEKWENYDKVSNWVANGDSKVFFAPEMDQFLEGSDVKNKISGLKIDGTSIELVDSSSQATTTSQSQSEQNSDWLFYTPSWVGGDNGSVGRRVDEVKSLETNFVSVFP